MVDRYYDDWASLTRAADSKVKEILTIDVAPVAEKILKRRVKSDIYDVYTPKPNGWVSIDKDGIRHRETYQRRHVLEDSITSYITGMDTLLVTATATASPSVVKGWSFKNRYAGAFLKLLESGNMGVWRGGFPRPAVTNTEREFLFGKDISSAVKRGIGREIGVCEEI